MRKGKCNDCKKCPYYYCYYNCYDGEGDEICGAGVCKKGQIGCNYPLIIRQFFYIREKIRELVAELRIKKEFAKMKRLGMTEEEYYIYKIEMEEKEC